MTDLLIGNYRKEGNSLESLYGENANPTQVQRCYAFIVRYLQNKSETQDSRLLILGAEKLEQELEKAKPAKNSPEFKKYLARKAFAISLRSNDTNEDKLLEQAISLIEPVRLSPEVICVHMENLLMMARNFKNCGKYEDAIRFFEKAIATYDEFQAAGYDVIKDVLTLHELFGVIKPRNIYQTLIIHRTMANSNIYECYELLKNTKMQLKFAIPKILSEMKIQEAAAWQTNKIMTYYFKGIRKEKTLDLYFSDVMPSIAPILKFLIDERHFAQIDFLLSALMQKLHYEKRLQTRTDTEYCEKIVSYLFALWGMNIVKYSLEARDDPKFAENNPISSEVEIIQELADTVGNRYEKQFPTSVIKEKRELSNIFKKAKFWAKQAREISKQEPFDKSCLKELKTLEHEIEEKMRQN